MAGCGETQEKEIKKEPLKKMIYAARGECPPNRSHVERKAYSEAVFVLVDISP
tara:strand:- start:84 stop:242 length:159 start_codon:yes stop_codon:yes gene_type:complete